MERQICSTGAKPRPSLLSHTKKRVSLASLRGSRIRSQGSEINAAADAPVVVPVSDRLSGEDLGKWEKSLEIVADLGFEAEKAEKLLARGFGWTSQAYWQGAKKDEVPEPAMIQERLAYLEEVGIKGADAATAVQKFPEVLGCDIEERLKPNMELLEKQYFLKGPIKAKVIMRKPKIMGNVIDCRGDCKGECSRCWAQF
ncbi:hypothetical protein BSKO_10087 [Bryopsis sp. KO-2023]|nr:hypothetical protein BSKO_10087 [Bryopsis sp. KO-2023]